MNPEVTFQLRDSFKYGDTGTGLEAEATSITIREPTGSMLIDAAPIRQGLVRAFQENEERNFERDIRFQAALEVGSPVVEVSLPDAPEDEEEEDPGPQVSAAEAVNPTLEPMDPVTVLAIISMSSVDLGTFYGHVRAFLLKPGVALVDGSQPMTAELIKRMSLTDSEHLIGTFCASFFAASS